MLFIHSDLNNTLNETLVYREQAEVSPTLKLKSSFRFVNRGELIEINSQRLAGSLLSTVQNDWRLFFLYIYVEVYIVRLEIQADGDISGSVTVESANSVCATTKTLSVSVYLHLQELSGVSEGKPT